MLPHQRTIKYYISLRKRTPGSNNNNIVKDRK